MRLMKKKNYKEKEEEEEETAEHTREKMCFVCPIFYVTFCVIIKFMPMVIM